MRQLQQRVEPLGAVAHPEHLAELPQAPAGQAIAVRQPHILGIEPRGVIAIWDKVKSYFQAWPYRYV